MTAGRARGIVVGTGASTAIGKIRNAMVATQEQDTPLKQKLDQFGTLLSKSIAVICILVWVVNLPHFSDPLHGSWFGGALYYFKIAVALAVAAIPEGLPAVVTTCLALGTRQMAKKNAIVRRLPSVETLGCTSVICSDKTGTLTTNQMSVVAVACLNDRKSIMEYHVSGTSYAPVGDILDAETGSKLQHPGDSQVLLQAGACSALCNDCHLTYLPDSNTYQRAGEATEVALRVLAEKIGLAGYSAMPSALAHIPPQERVTYCNSAWEKKLKKVYTLEFDRLRKMMSTLCEDMETGELLMYAKGAPEKVLARCTSTLLPDGTIVKMDESEKLKVYETINKLAGEQALRCLALAFKKWKVKQRREITAQDETELCFICVVGMQDPPRPEVKLAMQECQMAGIRVIMVTGDNKKTAESVGRQVGLVPGRSSSAADVESAVPSLLTLTGTEFDDLSNAEKSAAASEIMVFSRVEPIHKSSLVEILQSHGHIVAMTGDGVNDAPALKRADIGVAMGSGTSVAKHAADMVLADDNFATIVSAVAAGRSIYANTKQFIRYMVSSNIGEVVAIFSAAVLGIPECLNPVQLLWVNLVTDGLPATAIGFNKPDHDIMRKPPRKSTEGIVDRWLFFRYLIVGAYVGIATSLGFLWWFMMYDNGPKLSWSEIRSFQHCGEDKASSLDCSIFRSKSPSTIAMSVLVVVEMFNALNALSENCSIVTLPPWSNPWLLGAIAVSMLLHFIILYSPPLAMMFSVTALTWAEWKAILVLSFPVVLLDEVLKLFSRNFFSKSQTVEAPENLLFTFFKLCIKSWFSNLTKFRGETKRKVTEVLPLIERRHQQEN